ncbi:MAG TPA: SRPBCC family protein [Steroidobacteraceae bacterium]|nr:SRPBCC family protein [Steroidobacteraceae bacterium]
MRGAALSLACYVLASSPASGKVVESSAAGFTTNSTVTVAATPAQTWDALVHPARYWSSQHSWSGNAANLTLDPVAGGCFCERWQGRNGGQPGSAEHMRVINSEPFELLRMRGALGPLQSEALTGVLTVTLKPVEGGTAITWEYVVGGHARFDLSGLAPAVDGVLDEQLGRLADVLGRLETPRN